VPLFTLQMGGDTVGQNVQPRYLAPLILMLAAVLLRRPGGGARALSSAQTWTVYVFLVVAHCAALHELIRRYVTGTDGPIVNLNAAIEWWRPWLPSPMAVWMLGSIGFAAMALVLFAQRGTRAAVPQISAPGVDAPVGADLVDAGN